jgi:4-diphosphocytidyl-2-C-methyl-D-erythritol kinase
MPALPAPAKINLTLEVLSRREDGYHTLRSVMVPIGLYDRIELEAAEPGARGSFTVEGDAPGGAAEDNLVLRALEAAGVKTPMRVTLEKRVPIGGGLGGGSSDAAAVLRAAVEGRLGPAGADDWLGAARRLGSDVSFFMVGTAALVEGAGERVTALGKPPRWWAVVVQPPVSVATAEAYRLLDDARSRRAAPSRPRSESASLRAADALQRAEFAALAAELGNDFHEPILAAYPTIARADAALRAACGSSLLSGSGSCLFALFENENEARAGAARIVRDAVKDVFVVPFHRDDAWR